MNIWTTVAYGVLIFAAGIGSVFAGKKIKMGKVKSVPQQAINEIETLGMDAGRALKNAFENGHEAVVAHNFKAAADASQATSLAQEVDKLILQYAGAAGKSVSQLTSPDLQNVIAYVLHSVSPVNAHNVTAKSVADAHKQLVAAHNSLVSDPTFQANQVSAAYQASAVQPPLTA